MSWELQGCAYQYDENGVYREISAPFFLGRYNNFDNAFKAFSNAMNNSEYPRLWVRVFKDEEDSHGEIIVAYSNIWGDDLFNDDYRAV